MTDDLTPDDLRARARLLRSAGRPGGALVRELEWAATEIERLQDERRTAIDLWKEATTKLADATPEDIGMVKVPERRRLTDDGKWWRFPR